ncbi:MAG: hypothetical protein ACYDDI_15975 [Candidatus Acidiferrales bacterium]
MADSTVQSTVYSTMKEFCQRKSAYAPSNPCWALAFLGAESRVAKIRNKGIGE